MLGQIESLRCGDGFVVVCGWAAGYDLVGPPLGLLVCAKRGARVAIEHFLPREDLQQIGIQKPCSFRVHLSVPRDYKLQKEDFWLLAGRTKLLTNEHTVVTQSESYGGLDRLDAKGLHGWKYPLLPGDQSPLRLRVNNKATIEIRDFEIIDRPDVSTNVLPEKSPAAIGFLVSAETLRGALAITPGLDGDISSIELYDDAWQICASLCVSPSDAERESSYPSAAYQASFSTILPEVFDREWYLARYPDVAAAGVDPFRHYCETGMLEGRDPHPLFSVEYYVNSSLAGRIERGEAFRFFLEKGHEEGVDPHPCFSMSWYQSEYENRDSRNPWLDYVKDFGWRKGREPNWLFCSAYLSQIVGFSVPDERSPLVVFLTQHEAQGISPHPFFSSEFVVRHYGLSSSRAYTEYMSKSRDRWLRPSLLFDGDYAAKQAGHSSAGPSTLRDYVQSWEDRGIKPNEYFDPHWYKSINRFDRTCRTAFQHYLLEGERRSLSPCPGFSPRHYWEYNPDVARAGVSPLQHFVAAGAREKRRTHRAFDQDWYCSQHPSAAEAPLRHYLQTGRPAGHSPHPFVRVMERGDVVAASDVLFGQNRPSGLASLEFLLGQSGRADIGGVLSFEATVLESSKTQDEIAKCPETICRFYTSFDYGSADELYAELSADLAQRKLKAEADLVTVILPTRNRASVLRRAIDSVLTQTYSQIELIVVDDGSLDGTERLVADYYTDPRIRYVRVPAAGVSAARNRGLLEARGVFVAYLDSDNYWEPTHLEVCVAAMERDGSDAAYSALRIVSEGSIVGYRGELFDANALRRENYIDMNVYVHRRCVKYAVEFDTSLKRCVDWDFILRMSAIATPTYVPIIGCNYVDDQDALQRITTHELPGDFFRVCLRESHLTEHVVGCSDGRAEVSVVWPIGPGVSAADLCNLWEAAWSAQERSFEIIVVNNALPAAISRRLNELAQRIQNFRVINLWRSFYDFPALNLAAHHASGEYLMFWSTNVEFDPDAIEKLLHTIRTTGCSTVAPLVSRGDRVDSVYEWGLSGALLHPIVGEELPAGVDGLAYNAFPIFGPFLTNAAVFRAARGVNYDYARHYGFVDYALQSITLTPDSVATHLGVRLVGRGDRANELNAKEFEALMAKWIGVVPTRSTLPNNLIRRIGRKQEHAVQSGRVQVSRSNASIIERRPTRNKRVAIRTPAPNGNEAQWWGDFHFANSMARALGQFNCDVRVLCKEDWGGIGEDLTIHLRGAHATSFNPVSRNIVWIISHPDRIPPDEMAAADVLFVGSETLRLDIRRRHGLDSEVLLQATDEFKFWPRRAPLLDEIRSKALFVGNSRMQLRPIVADALEAGLPLAIYGREWEPFAPSGVVIGKYLPNEDLALWYQSALVVLNDHWPSMRQAGILSNRLFDVVASGGVAITDKIEGVDAVFGDHVRCYSDRDELSDLIQNLNDWAPSRQRRLEQSAYFRRHHSFTERMRTLWEVVQ